MTTPDGALKMSDQGTAGFRRGGSDALTISVDPAAATVDIRPASARLLRVVQTGSAPQWWSVADLRVYR